MYLPVFHEGFKKWQIQTKLPRSNHGIDVLAGKLNISHSEFIKSTNSFYNIIIVILSYYFFRLWAISPSIVTWIYLEWEMLRLHVQ